MSTDVALSDFRFRRNARFRYVYGMFCEWEHEIRVEERLAAAPGKHYPRCVGGAGACLPEDCGGPDAYHARREEATGLDAMNVRDLVGDAGDVAVHGFAFPVSENKLVAVLPRSGRRNPRACGARMVQAFLSANCGKLAEPP